MDSKQESEANELNLDIDLDLNEMNFNLMKNSNTFKPIKSKKANNGE